MDDEVCGCCSSNQPKRRWDPYGHLGDGRESMLTRRVVCATSSSHLDQVQMPNLFFYFFWFFNCFVLIISFNFFKKNHLFLLLYI
jgi:hypothetical protein